MELPNQHDLKVWPEFFKVLWCGDKAFEIRVNDRDFKERDVVILEEWEPAEKEYTGRQIEGFITYITSFEQKPGWVVFSFREVHRSTE